MQLSLSLLGDVFWIAALSLMAGSSRWAWKQIPRGVKVPVQWNREGVATVRLNKGVSLIGLVVIAFAIGAYMKIESLSGVHGFDTLMIVFLVRLTAAPLFAVIHLIQVRRALVTLDEDGQLEP
jgi:hypothetical protein